MHFTHNAVSELPIVKTVSDLKNILINGKFILVSKQKLATKDQEVVLVNWQELNNCNLEIPWDIEKSDTNKDNVAHFCVLGAAN